MIDKTKKFSVVETLSELESESGLTADTERCEQLAGLGVTGKAFSVLEVVSQNPEATKMAEIIHGTGMTKPTAHRVVNMLLDMGFLERDGLDNGFVEGAGLVDLAHRTLAAAAPRSLRHSILEGISEQVGETVNYGVLNGSEVIYLDRVEAKWPLGLRFDAGSRVPAHCTSIGKLLLSRMSDSDLRALIESMPRPAYTTNTITDVKPLLSVLENIRRDGIGADDQEFMHGVVCVSVPVVDKDGRCFGGIAISAPEARITRHQTLTHGPHTRTAAESLAAAYRRSSSRYTSRRNLCR
jgi:DNA-binding IclR family transcriptional regulator